MFKIVTLKEELIWRAFSMSDLSPPYAHLERHYVMAVFWPKLLLTVVKEAITACHHPLYPQQLSVKYLSSPMCFLSLLFIPHHIMKLYNKELEIRLVCPVAAAEFASNLCSVSHYVCSKNGSLLSIHMQRLMKDHMQYHVVI